MFTRTKKFGSIVYVSIEQKMLHLPYMFPPAKMPDPAEKHPAEKLS